MVRKSLSEKRIFVVANEFDSCDAIQAEAIVDVDILFQTERAASRIKDLLSSQSATAQGVRVGVKTRGCSGLSYTMDYATEQRRLESVVEQHGVKVFVEPKAEMYLVGTVMDFVQDEVKAEFTFENPNKAGECGCGESWYFKKDELGQGLAPEPRVEAPK